MAATDTYEPLQTPIPSGGLYWMWEAGGSGPYCLPPVLFASLVGGHVYYQNTRVYPTREVAIAALEAATRKAGAS